MAHQGHNRAYTKLIERLNRFPQGAPPSQTLYKILQILFSKEEAELVSKLPIRPFTAEKAAEIWKVSRRSAEKKLDGLAKRALLVDLRRDSTTYYVLPPPMAGFIEFSMMRVRGDIDQKLLAELFYQYINVEEDFVKELFLAGGPPLGRVFVQEKTLTRENSLRVLDYDRASEVIKTSPQIGISMCYCRHKKMHLGTACNAPMEICMTFNTIASSLIRHGHARKVDAAECLSLLDTACDNNLVQFGDNSRIRVNFICNCCPCCCEAMTVARTFGFPHPVATTSFIATEDKSKCNGCLRCVAVCPVEAIAPFPAGNTAKPNRKTIRINKALCLGCGVCVRNCNPKAIRMEHRKEKVIPPLNASHRMVAMAVERGKLQHLIFDNQILLSHRMLSIVLGTILRLPLIKQLMANKQINSRYMETLITRLEHQIVNNK